MRILYVAKHGSGDNDDEGAIAFALEKLGHQVVRVSEESSNLHLVSADFCLFHKGFDVVKIIALRIPKVFWYFDLIKSKDHSLDSRLLPREAWVNEVLPHCLCGFCSDGDYVARVSSFKLLHLMQGCDERAAWDGNRTGELFPFPIVFPGSPRVGTERRNHIEALRRRYPTSFSVVGESTKIRRHGSKLSRILVYAKITIAPIGPTSDRYWSNRIYLVTSLGGFLIHPRCSLLEEHYTEGEEIVCYKSIPESFDKIDYYLTHDEERERIRVAGWKRALASNTYYHRCKYLISQVESRMACTT